VGSNDRYRNGGKAVNYQRCSLPVGTNIRKSDKRYNKSIQGVCSILSVIYNYAIDEECLSGEELKKKNK
jgi:hypothetical protein